MKNQRIDDPRFDGGGLVVYLVGLVCFSAGVMFGGLVSQVLS